jgi:ABC-2 type transport system ATP-binding protein
VFKSRLRVVDSPSRLRQQLYGRQVIFHLAETAESHLSVITDLPFIKEAKAVDSKLVVDLDDPESHNPEIIRLLVQAGARIQFVGELRHTLEDVYLQLVKDEDDGEG